MNLYLLQHPQSWLSNLDGRTKLAMFFAYVLAVLFTKPNAYWTWLFLTGLLLILFTLARIQIRWITLRLVPVLPFVALGAFGVLLGGSKEMFLQVTVKTLLCVGAAVWLSGTTPFTHLLEALRKLKVPSLLTVMLSFMFRYLFVLAEEAVRMSRAYQSRCPRKQTLRDAENIGRLAGALMLRTYNRAERIYLAMLSRGFSGEFRTLSVQRMTFADIAFLAIFVGLVTTVFVVTQ
ncbi:cobalt/nickel transport system permease protein [Candidatus Fervidibacteria bacterium JGI MDM2 SSWTFF-3-K9]